METVGERLKKIREKLGFTQNEMAEMVGLKQPGYADKERNISNLSFKTIEILVNQFHVSIDWLLTGEGTMFKKGSAQTVMTNNLNGLGVQSNVQMNGVQDADYLRRENELLKSQLKDKETIISLLKSKSS